MPNGQQLPGGSFGVATGGSDALREAFERRGVDASILDQVTPGAVGGTAPMPQSPGDLSVAQAALPQGEPIPATPTAMPTTPPAPSDPELAIALEALGGFVKAAGQTRRDLAKARIQGIV